MAGHDPLVPLDPDEEFRRKETRARFAAVVLMGNVMAAVVVMDNFESLCDEEGFQRACRSAWRAADKMIEEGKKL